MIGYEKPTHLGLQFLFAGGGAHQVVMEAAKAEKVIRDWLDGRLPNVLQDLAAPLPWAMKTASIILIGAFAVPPGMLADAGAPVADSAPSPYGQLSGVPWPR